MSPPRLLPAGPEDAGILAAMAREVIFEVYTYVPAERVEKFYREHQTPEAIREQMADGYVYAFIAVDDDRIGYLSRRIAGGLMEIDKYYILSGRRGRGAGSAVMGMLIAEAEAASADRIRLQVNGRNRGALRFYGRCGFAVTGTQRAYGTEILTMELELR
jgi:ribosomal protein S18 acetylase RimI-like enzyme